MFDYIKKFLKYIPWPIGILISKVNFRYRPFLGRRYVDVVRKISDFEGMSSKCKKEYILSQLNKSLNTSLLVPYYRDLYSSLNLSIGKVHSLSEFTTLPIVNKQMLQGCDIEYRSVNYRNRYQVNTGGSSGEPLSFYLTPNHTSLEWAHMHTIWEKLNFSQDKLKLVFSGINIGNKHVVYDGLRHSYILNTYKSFRDTFTEVEKIILKRKIEYLHGYPSLIYDFCCFLNEYKPEFLTYLRRHLKGVFLGSEFPILEHRNVIERTLGVSTISWYGHTERSALAYEKDEKYVYHVFQTYGYCEAVKNADDSYNLVVTSYSNKSSPFIRYDTGDEIKPILVQDGILKSFKIKGGRQGDYIYDINGVKISLTALIFGRHHRLFEVARFVQVRQTQIGRVTFLITPGKSFPIDFNVDDWMDLSSVDIEYDYDLLSSPKLSPLGKFMIKIN